ncbi:cysteine dioxygenase family protein [Allokutzneria multivorans]|uniref:Cysteine dioxygenase family protein n=1 Tax=Allokutzneria multivorans TaxID=1142134 RepID=A0ABP7TNB6_9PSEU
MAVSLSAPEIHPALDLPLLRDFISPRRPLWTASELLGLTKNVAAVFEDQLAGVLEYVPEQRWWARLALTDEVELWLLSWMPGQGTEPHDHGGASGSFTVYRGELREDYRYPTGPVRGATRKLGTGVGFGPGRAHQVRNTGALNAASVHAYSPPLLPTNEYTSLEAYTEAPQA